jgi:hypothetical protein
MSKATRARWRNIRRKARSRRRADRAFIAGMRAMGEACALFLDQLFESLGVPESILRSDERAGLSSAARDPEPLRRR